MRKKHIRLINKEETHSVIPCFSQKVKRIKLFLHAFILCYYIPFKANLCDLSRVQGPAIVNYFQTRSRQSCYVELSEKDGRSAGGWRENHNKWTDSGGGEVWRLPHLLLLVRSGMRVTRSAASFNSLVDGRVLVWHARRVGRKDEKKNEENSDCRHQLASTLTWKPFFFIT